MNSMQTNIPAYLAGMNVPRLRCQMDAYLFDKFALVVKPMGYSRMMRQCFRFELPPGKFDELSSNGKLPVLQVCEIEPGVLHKGVFVLSKVVVRNTPMALCESVGVVIQKMNDKGKLQDEYFHGEELVAQTDLSAFQTGGIRFNV
jgi:hypothetical protein